MVTFSDRLREERNRLGMKQPEFAALADTTKKSQVAYEGEKLPAFADYLQKIAAAGVDVGYIITGERASQGKSPFTALSEDEAALIKSYRMVSPELKAAARGMLEAACAAQAGKPEERLAG